MWQPLSRETLRDMIENAEVLMEPSVRAFWDRIKTPPEKWQCSPWGDAGGGFWVVAVIGQTCIYYNDIEDGFNGSTFERWGRIMEYGSNQAELLAFIAGYYGDFVEASTLKR